MNQRTKSVQWFFFLKSSAAVNENRHGQSDLKHFRKKQIMAMINTTCSSICNDNHEPTCCHSKKNGKTLTHCDKEVKGF